MIHGVKISTLWSHLICMPHLDSIRKKWFQNINFFYIFQSNLPLVSWILLLIFCFRPNLPQCVPQIRVTSLSSGLRRKKKLLNMHVSVVRLDLEPIRLSWWKNPWLMIQLLFTYLQVRTNILVVFKVKRCYSRFNFHVLDHWQWLRSRDDLSIQ